MIDTSKLTAAADQLKTDVNAVVAMVQSLSAGDPANQAVIDAAVASITASDAKLAALVPPPPVPTPTPAAKP